MEYFDSKVLESFMIPEDSIATEGIIGKAFNLIVAFVKFIIRMIGNLISIIGKILGKFAHGKTVHNDKETYKKNQELVNKYYDTITGVHFDMQKIVFEIATLANIANARFFIKEMFDSDKDNIDKGYDKFAKDCNIINKELSGKVLFLNKAEYDSYTSTLNKSKEKLEKCKGALQKVLDKVKDETSQENNEIISETQKRSAYYLNMMSKVSSLYTTTCNTLNKCISSDIITMEDVMKYHDFEKHD